MGSLWVLPLRRARRFPSARRLGPSPDGNSLDAPGYYWALRTIEVVQSCRSQIKSESFFLSSFTYFLLEVCAITHPRVQLVSSLLRLAVSRAVIYTGSTMANNPDGQSSPNDLGPGQDNNLGTFNFTFSETLTSNGPVSGFLSLSSLRRFTLLNQALTVCLNPS
ncbi:hypothetical protein BD289DRAFT_126333 [Coniella lustricola]|uniref:Uncharacterized protein n=1 Tax=Coniella lustricola TaxID=2025994 RepID=A0A2T3AFY1_9PEZI|nr:hypothetical protein BD289DRAFT_126333 [Coniella lustricola]